MTDADNEIVRQVRDRVAAEETLNDPGGDPGDGKPSSKLINDCMFANVHGDGSLFAWLFREKFVYNKNKKEWFVWNGQYWEHDIMGLTLGAVEDLVTCYLDEYRKISEKITKLVESGETDSADGAEKEKGYKVKQAALLKRARQLRDEKRRNGCLNFSHTLKEGSLGINGREFDRDPWLLACANGVINLKTGDLEDGRPGDYISMASPIEWQGIDAPADLWEKTLLEIFAGDEEIVAYLQRLFGYCITGIVTEKVFPILLGKSGWNGRSLIMDTFNYVMGPLVCGIPSEMLLSSRNIKSSSGPSPDIMILKGRRLVFASETDDGHKFNAAIVKKLTGKDELQGRNPNDKYFTFFDPTHKLILMTNTPPAAPSHDKAFWERVHLINFPISFVNREPQDDTERRAILNLDTQVKKEAPGILAWLVRGCLLWQKYGIDPPKQVTEATMRYRRNEDILADYIEECCLREAGAKEEAGKLYARFVRWYHDNIGKKEPTGTTFGKMLSHKFDKSKSGGRNIYHGICLADGQEAIPDEGREG